MNRSKKTFNEKLNETMEVNWLVEMGLIETASILFPGRASHYTDGYLDHMVKYWSLKW